MNQTHEDSIGLTMEDKIATLLKWMGAVQLGNGLAYFPKTLLPMLHALHCNPTNSDEHDDKVLAMLPPLTLDLMHEAEKSLPDVLVYADELDRLTGRKSREFEVIHATKEQRLEALLKTISGTA